jgi:hypothetical protein
VLTHLQVKDLGKGKGRRRREARARAKVGVRVRVRVRAVVEGRITWRLLGFDEPRLDANG